MNKRIVHAAAVLAAVFACLFTAVTPANALNFNGSASSGDSGSASTNASGSYGLPAFVDSEYNAAPAYRFTLVNSSGTDMVDSVDIYRSAYSKYMATGYHKFSTKYPKTVLKSRYSFGSFSTSATNTNCYIDTSLLGISLPTRTTGMEAWSTETNMSILLKKAWGCSISTLNQNGWCILVEPIYPVKLEGQDHSLTVTEIAVYGAAKFGASTVPASGTNTDSWDWISNYTNRLYPNSLRLSKDYVGLSAVSELSSRASFGTIITQGYGAAVVYGEYTTYYYLDVNGYLDGAEYGSTTGYGTFDVYINGSLVADDVSDYWTKWPSGTTYSITDIKAATGKTYHWVHSGYQSGTINSTTTTVLTFTTTTYNNTISHFACDFNGYGNYEWNRNAFLLGQTTVSSQYNKSFTLDRENAVTIPNGFYLAQTFGTSAITGSWAGYPMGTSVTQKPNTMGFEYDYNPISYKIKYNLNGGTNNSSNPSTYDVLDSVYLKNPTRDGYVFEGWYGDVLDVASSADKRSYLYIPDKISFVNNVDGNSFSNTKFQIRDQNYNFLTEPVKTTVTGEVKGQYTHTYSTGYYKVLFGANGSTSDTTFYTNVYLVNGRTYDISWTQEKVSSSEMIASNLSVKPSSSGKIVMTNSVDGNSFSNTKFQIRDQNYNFLTEPVKTTVTGEVKGQYTHTYSTGYYKVLFGANGSTSDTTFYTNVYLVNGRTYDISWTQEKVSSSEMIASNLKMQGIVSSINPDAKVDFTNSDANELNAHLNNRTTGDMELTAKWKAQILFDVNHDSINTNIFDYTSNYNLSFADIPLPKEAGVTDSFNRSTSVITLDGTQTQNFGLSYINNLKFVEGEKYTVTLTYVGGSYYSQDSSKTAGVFAFDVRNEGTRMSYLDLYLPTAENKVVTQTLTITGQQAESADVIWCWLWKNGAHVFEDYQFKVKIEKSEASTDFSPNALHAAEGEEYGELPVPSREGYTFDGWYTSAEGGEKITADTEVTGSATLYAHWLKDIISYTVTYNPNGGESAPESQTKIHGIDLTLSSVEPTRSGYMFMGWNTEPDNSGDAYPPGSIYTADESVTLYAQWNVNIKTVYKVKHWLQNIDGDASLKDSNNYTLEETESFTNEICGDVNLDGYVNAFDLTELRKILLNASVNSEVQAASDINGDSVVDIRDLVRLKKYLAGLTDATVTPVVKYYTGFTSPSAQSVTVKPDGSTVVNYYYTRNSYTVTVNKENGISSVSGAGTYLYGASVTIDATICSGYTWSKWSGTHSTETQKYTFTMPAQNVVDTASATPNSYKVEYNGNGSTGGSTPSSTHVFDVEKALNDNGFTRSGHKFTGWNTKADGSGTAYADKEVVKNLTSANGETVVLYAQWINVSDAVYKKLTLIALDPNAPYREKTDVITSYWIVNSSDQDCIPTDDIKVKFTVYNINGDLLEQVTKTAIVPANDKNLLYFKWRVPTDLSEKDVIIKAVIIGNDGEYGLISKSYATIPYLYYSTPDTKYEEKAPDGFSVPSVPTDTGILQAKWWEYKYENGTFEKVHYGIGTKINLSALTAPNSLSAVISNGKLTLRSGYGFRSPFSAVSLGIEGYTVPDVSSYSSRQYAFALFPEFNYTFGENKCKTMREIGGLFNFGTAADELTDHYIPLYYPDGEYTFKIVTSDSWTPAGMITTSELQTLNVSGTLYDDHYIGRK